MGRPCTVCSHPQRTEIEKLRLGGVRSGLVAAQFGVSKKALQRHVPHIQRRLELEEKAQAATQPATLLDSVRQLQARTLNLLDTLEARRGRPHHILAAIREVRANFELLARMVGELQDKAAVQVNILKMPETVTLVTRLRDALTPYPEAKNAVLKVLDE